MTWEKWEYPKPEPNKLKILPIIPASTSQNSPLFSHHYMYTYYIILFPSYLSREMCNGLHNNIAIATVHILANA